MANIPFEGGDKLGKYLQAITEKAGRAGTLKVGFFPTAKYPDGTYVAQVAFWNEFGTVNAVARPFFRNMIAAKSPKWGEALAKIAEANNYDFHVSMGQMGEGIKDQLVTSIVEFTSPPLKPSTILRKGFAKPLIDTGLMQRSVGYEVTE